MNKTEINCAENKYADVVKVMIAERTCKTGGRFGRDSYGSYQTLGDLNLEFAPLSAPVSEYRRWLDIGEAVAGVSSKVGDDVWTREIFSSAVDQTLVVRITCGITSDTSSAFRLILAGRRTPPCRPTTGCADSPRAKTTRP